MSKAAGFEGGLFQKLFKGYIFCFLGFWVICPWNEFEEKEQCAKCLNTYSTNILSLFLVLPSPFLPLSSFISSMGRMPNICCNFTMTGINNFCPKIIRHSSKIMRPFSKLKILNCKKRFFSVCLQFKTFCSIRWIVKILKN